LTLASVGQLLWAAQGVTSSTGERTAPSAGALYPLEIFLAAGTVDGLAAGVYRYSPQDHALRLHLADDRRRELAAAALEQSAVEDASAVLVIAAVYARTARKYGTRAERYVHIEVGHAAQNVYLQAQALGLGTVIIGAFDDEAVGRVLELDPAEASLALMPVGTPSA
jgi:SagB-type dehydrogenase family enzyme